MRIYLFRGLLGAFFSRGIDTLAKKLKADGHTVSVHSWVSRIIVEKEVKKLKEPVGFVGHSLGGNSANYAALYVQKAGGTVLGLACIDPTVPKPVSGIEGYTFRSNDIRDKSVEGLVTIQRDDLSHTEIDKDEIVHNLIIKLFKRTT